MTLLSSIIALVTLLLAAFRFSSELSPRTLTIASICAAVPPINMPGKVLRSLVVFVTVWVTLASMFKSEHSTGYPEDVAYDKGDYGVDASYPIHHFLNEGSERHKYYMSLLQGCYKMYSKAECDATERDRIRMSMVRCLAALILRLSNGNRSYVLSE